jgi:hypothetical protein
MRRAGRILVVGVALCSAVACSGEKAPVSVHSVSFDELEKKLAHPVVQPKTSLGASLVKSALLEPSGSTFKGASAAASYRWKQVLVLIKQGRPADGFKLHEFIKRGDVIYETRPSGAEVALLPQVEATSASAYLIKADWLLQVDIVPVAAKGVIPLDDLKAVVGALEL